jgi:transposase-like protein
MSKSATKTKKSPSKSANPAARSAAAAIAQLALPLAAVLRKNLHEFVTYAGMAALTTVLEEERAMLCGPAYARGREGLPTRAGSADGWLVLGGRRVHVKRPRARHGGAEVPLSSWSQFSNEDPLHDRAFEQMVLGVSTRRYARSLEQPDASVDACGTSKSAVSRRFVARTRAELDKWLEQPLGELSIACVMIDGVHIDEHVVLVALGIDEHGTKHLLGLWNGATENATVVTKLVADLVDRGLDSTRRTLFVVDGAKALHRAITNVFGANAAIQRCQEHKKRNVADHLPKRMHANAKKAMNDAFRAKSAKLGIEQLRRFANGLRKQHPAAAASLLEGLEEMFTVKSLGITGALERTLATTNPIENVMSTIRRVSKRVHRWKNEDMVRRWVGAGLVEARKGFRRLRGHRDMPKLVAALRGTKRGPLEVVDADHAIRHAG